MAKASIAFVLSAYLLQLTYAQSFQDSTQVHLLKQLYNAHCAFVLDGKWSTTQGTRNVGKSWRLVADEFRISPEGNLAYQLARNQRKRGTMFGLLGVGMALGTAPLLNNSSSTMVGIGTTLGGLTFSMISLSNNSRSRDNFEKALWLRNRDAMVQHISILSQPIFQRVYESETIYLTNGGFVKNGKKYRIGVLGKNAAAEFRNTPTSRELYQQYRINKLTGLALYSAGIGSIFASLLVTGNKRVGYPANVILYMGGLSASLAGAGLMSSSYKRLRQAVHFRNYEAIEQGMFKK